MKVGTDAVLLGAWANVEGAKKILDVGTGCGVIGLMLAQRTGDNVHVDAIEIEHEDAVQAKENVSISPWHNKISVFQKPFQQFDRGYRYDLLVSNPPYFSNSLKPPSHHRTRARHTEQITFEELITNSIHLMKPHGILAVILPFPEGKNFQSLAAKNGIHLIRQLAVFSRKEKPQERWLLEFGFTKGATLEEALVLYEKNNLKSEAYFNLTKDFYLRNSNPIYQKQS